MTGGEGRGVTARSGARRIVILGLSISSSWGNGHATTYRALVRALCARGHEVLFLERDVAWYADNRDLPHLPHGRLELYTSLDELSGRWAHEIRDADCVVVGSYVPDGVAVGDWVLSTATGVTAFYDIDTPVTLAALDRGECTYVAPAQIPRYHLYLSFTGGPTLARLEGDWGARRARPLYCSFDPDASAPASTEPCWDLGYMGTYSADRQPALGELLLAPAQALPARRFVVAGAGYPLPHRWPRNVEYRVHVPPGAHRAFYTAQRFTLNLTRAEMVRVGYSPSIRLFEAAACGAPIISDWWAGLETFFVPGEDILIATRAEDVRRYLHELSADDRAALASNARRRVLEAHTPEHRAAELEQYIDEASGSGRAAIRPDPAEVAARADVRREVGAS